jgi:hypothetical protein
MGLLDDAIREHLELKRKRGADPAEVAKQEREALGPIGAGTAAAAPPTAGAVAPELDEELPDAAADAAPAALAEEEPQPPGRAFAEEPPAYEPPPAREPAGAVRMPEPEAEPEPRAPEPPAPAPAAPPLVEQPTQQFRAADVEDDVVPADEEPEEGEDVLDETPDFLQEAPEHDRLWFEQRPPRDFDF